MDTSDWESILPARLPDEFSSHLSISRNDTIAQRLFQVDMPVLKCVSFFPGKSPADVVLSLCDIPHRLAWDVNYRAFVEIPNANESFSTGPGAKPTTAPSLESLLRHPLRTMCHKVALPALNSVGLGGRVFCYDRAVAPLFGGGGRRTAHSLYPNVDAEADGFDISFRHRDPFTYGRQLISSADVAARVVFQQYIVRRVKRDGQSGTELTMTTCADIGLPSYFPRALQNYISARFTTKSFLSLRDYLDKTF
ncbi:hypothetical protein XU18_3493 [Perkinsela sp. CCAP 1560/4]|nr:hypothetical protein XU18_3493 [Perkinsela sp. CCAP 1560/4]|eukprot:KNH05522.1 hypothetical protein XU18_3493 [Perkinsela sp. CCAP 1560/4]